MAVSDRQAEPSGSSKVNGSPPRPRINGFHSNGRAHLPNGHSKKRRAAWVEMSDDDASENASFVPNGPLMNGHSTPKGKAARKKLRTNESISSQKTGNLQEQRRQLPIYSGKEALIREIRENDITILVGETGSGKTTQVPQYLLEAGLGSHGMIAVTQPRRVAAISLATRVAAEQSARLGSLVGYQVRFDERASPDTKIKYVTDGMLVRELLGDPLLSRYSVVVVDEAHERTLRTDLLIANLKTILKRRNGTSINGSGKGKGKARDMASGLKVIIMSATLDAEKFSKFFESAKVLYVKGRQHAVKICHTTESVTDYVEAATRTFYQIHVDQPPGDVLIFMPGQEDIESVSQSIKLLACRLPTEAQEVELCPLYAALAPAQQFKIFSPTPSGKRKCIIATNIAETSITVPGVKYVIDSGKYKEKNYVVRKGGQSGFDALLVKDITKSSAMQRAGRAGREGPGQCFRLFTEDAYEALPVSAEPEIRRCSLAGSMLEQKCLGFDLDEIEFMDPPDAESVASALKTLFFIRALDKNKQLTQVGRQMAKFPLEPVHACAVIAAALHGPAVLSSVTSVVSAISATSKLFLEPSDTARREEFVEARRKFRHPSGDHMTLLSALRAYEEIAAAEAKGGRKDWCRRNFVNERACQEVLSIREQVRGVCKMLGMDVEQPRASASTAVVDDAHEEGVLRSLASGYVLNAAVLQADGSYRQTTGMATIKIHPGSTLSDKKVPAIIYDELTYTTQIYARGVSAVPQQYITIKLGPN